MFKLDKSTHMMILFTFALVFVVIYLYYTITDVRKMQRDIVRLSGEVSALTQAAASASQSAAPKAVPLPPAAPFVQVKECTTIDEDEEDDDSVSTEDIKATLDTHEEDEKEEVNVEEVVIEEVSLPQPHQEEGPKMHQGVDLNKLKFEEIKDMCRAKNIKIQGSKEVLIKRLMDLQA